jgi:hypothetical protein
MDAYKVGSGNQHIRMTADIETLQLASSRAIAIDLNSDDPGKPVANSDDASGDIIDKSIGSASSLKGKRLSILTRVDLFGTLEERKAAYRSLTATYILERGTDGKKEFIKPTKTAHQNHTRAFLHKKIDLTD